MEGVWPERIALDTLVYYRKTKRPDIYAEYAGLASAQGEGNNENVNKSDPNAAESN